MPCLTALTVPAGCCRLAQEGRQGQDVLQSDDQRELQTGRNLLLLLPHVQSGQEDSLGRIDKDGMKVLDHIPPAIIAGKNESDMKVSSRTGV